MPGSGSPCSLFVFTGVPEGCDFVLFGAGSGAELGVAAVSFGHFGCGHGGFLVVGLPQRAKKKPGGSGRALYSSAFRITGAVKGSNGSIWAWFGDKCFRLLEKDFFQFPKPDSAQCVRGRVSDWKD